MSVPAVMNQMVTRDMGRVGCVGHIGCHCVHTGQVIQYDATSASSAYVLMAGGLVYKGWDHVEHHIVWASEIHLIDWP